MMKIIPSLLSFPRENWEHDLPKLLAMGYDTVHFDVMDESTVGATAFNAEDLRFVQQFPFTIHVHLMVAKPWEMAPVFQGKGVTSITFECAHLTDSEIRHTLETIHRLGQNGGIAIRPTWSNYDQYLDACEIVTVMGVQPGRGGQQMMAEGRTNLKFVNDLKLKYGYHYQIEFDGGINATTLTTLPVEPTFVVSGYYFYHTYFLKSVD